MQKTNHRRTIPAFRPATRRLVCQDLAKQLQAAIEEGKFAEGEQLPPEGELRILFQTSRETVRQALRLLEEKGLVEIRDHSMRRVHVSFRPTEHGIANLDLLTHGNRLSLDHIADFRKMLESRIAVAAAKKADSTDIRLLFDLTERVGCHIDKGRNQIPAFIDADKQVHMALARITGNPLYAHLIEVTHGIKRYFDRFTDMSMASMLANVEDLRQISIAVSRHDLQDANAHSRDHVYRFNQL